MDFMNIFTAVLVLGVMGAVFAAILGISSKVFAVEEDERLPLILEALPGANCGGCGFPGCSNFASAVIDGKAPPSGCPVGGAECATKVSEIMGLDASSSVRQVACVGCSGGINATKKFAYEGIEDCLAATQVLGGPVKCSYGCLGFGTCAKVCPFDAIEMVDGVARVQKDKCTSCAKCVSACPKNLIEIVSEKQKVFVACASKDKGGVARNLCNVSCIGCKLCEKECPFDAIHVQDNIAIIDYGKCKNCGKCVPVCPRKLIVNERKPVVKPPVKESEEKPA